MKRTFRASPRHTGRCRPSCAVVTSSNGSTIALPNRKPTLSGLHRKLGRPILRIWPQANIPSPVPRDVSPTSAVSSAPPAGATRGSYGRSACGNRDQRGRRARPIFWISFGPDQDVGFVLVDRWHHPIAVFPGSFLDHAPQWCPRRLSVAPLRAWVVTSGWRREQTGRIAVALICSSMFHVCDTQSCTSE